MKFTRSMCLYATVAMLLASISFAANNSANQTTSQFQGPKANTRTAMYFKENGKGMLKVSDDFKVPDTPAPNGA